MRLGGEVLAVVAQHAQVLPVGGQDVGDREPGRFQLAAEPLVFGLLGAGLAEQFGLVLQDAARGRDGQPRHRVRVTVELGQDRELVQGQLLIQVLRPAPGSASDSRAAASASLSAGAGQPGGFAQPGLGGAGLPGREQRVGLFQHGERVAVPVHVDHVQVLARLIPGPVAHQVIGHLAHAGLQRGRPAGGHRR